MTSRLTLRMDEDMKERAKRIARRRGTSLPEEGLDALR
jgi:DNA polymerase III delta prime subunit